MIHAIAIDDEPKAISIIENYISKLANVMLLNHFYDPKKALAFLKQHPVDLIFLDINMPHMSGLEMLQNLQLKPLVIFTTAYSEFALESYNMNAVDYLLKPFEFARFQITIKKVEDRLSVLKSQNTFFFVKDGFKNIRLLFDEILFIKGAGNYLDITTKEKKYSPRMTFIDVVAKLPSQHFIRIHQSYIVNISAIDKIENNHIHIGTHKAPISTKYREVLFKRLNIS
ncbi:LytR/AlgR family response regulator transcription factor [Kriegella aquimaris]|uniref:Two component transcriptional regulator, LytTR family n=1 Tax=Kriegella aquimaris TaxID=192904 RepID=A0A1G9M0R7_9FLAO|nr:LytTR family DNA-binding domain-containing protein [Kriegella aquimaris]SDL67850.1 two component transcriptional regulator, LytTR family [Kriegella aquimaris]